MGISRCYCSENRQNHLLDEDFFSDPDSDSYDMILNFYSLKQLKDGGYCCYFNPEGIKKYKKCRDEYNVVIGILGMKNRGKSYLLSRLMQTKNYEAPSGFLRTTYGISINFPQLAPNGAFFITLDTAGKDSPLLRNMIFKDNIKDFVNDQAITEIVLSDFIIQESNILIAMMEQLSFEEQRMLSTLIERLKKKDIKGLQKRKLLVIHNLMNISTVDGIKQFIRDILLKSLTFRLEKQSMWKNAEFDDSNKYVYVQIIDNEKENENKLEIIHLIFGNDDIEEIREEYNEPALRYIRDYISINTTRKFDIVQSFPDFIIKNSKKYLTGIELNKNSIKIKNEKPLHLKTINKSKTTIPLKTENLEFEVKAFVKDIGGNEIFYNKINPRYSSRLIKKDDNKYYIEIAFELYGKVKKLKRKVIPDEDKNLYIVVIKGEIEEIEEKIEKCEGNLVYTGFEFQIVIPKFIYDDITKKEIELEITRHKPKDIKFNEKDNSAMYKDYLEASIYENEI